jgi:hypothetical protein
MMRSARRAVPALCLLLLCMIAAVAAYAADWVDPVPVSPREAKLSGTSGPPASTAAASPLEVAQWSLSDNGGGRRLVLTLDGGAAAVERLGGGGLTIQVHWVREAAGGPAAPNLVTEIAVGRPELAATLAGQVRRNGFFEWHSWAEKRSLSPGVWSVSLTWPDGQPVLCKPEQTPCRFSFTVG